MTRKDYIAIAGAIKGVLNIKCDTGQEQNVHNFAVEIMAGRIAGVCARDNAGFDPKRFFTACGLYKGN